MLDKWQANNFFRAAYWLPFFFFAAILIYANACGLYLTHDSEFYLQAAHRMRQEGRLQLFYSPLFSHWPPLYPFMLSFFTDLPTAYLIVHVGCLLLSYWLWIEIGSMVLHQRVFRILFGLLLSLSTPWLLVGHFLWSEALFILLFSAYLYLLLRYVDTEKSYFLLAATVFAFLLPWQRIAGVFVFLGVATGILFFFFPFFKKHWQKWVLHGLVSSLSFISWFVYTTFVLDGRTIREGMGVTAISSSIFQSLSDYLQILSRWLVPKQIPDLLSFGLVAAFLVVPGFFIHRKTQHGRISGFLWMLMLVYIFLYVTVPAVSAEVGGIDETERFLSVIYPVFFLSFLFGAEQYLKVLKPKFQMILYILVMTWLLYPAARMLKNAYFFHERSSQQAADFLYFQTF
jgi:hypothetical protein